MKNITYNPGLLASELGRAKLVEGHHTLTHYYDLTELTDKIMKTKTTYLETLETIRNDRSTFDNIQLLTSTINFTFELIDRKLENLHIHLNNRHKRGLINGLGSMIKFITGNLDANDERKYDEIVKHLHEKQLDLQTQIAGQYSINEEMQANLNKTMEVMNHNNKKLKEELKFLQSQNPKFSRLSVARSTFEHHQIVLNIITNTIQDIENSLTACKTGTIHPSVIDSKILSKELSKLSNYYGNRFLNFENQNLFEIQQYINVRCYVGSEEIVYFLEIPIVNPNEYVMYHLEPIPTITDQQYVTIIPTTNYFLKSDTEVLSLQQRCPSGHIQLCPNYFISPQKPACETKFLTTSSTIDCKFVALNSDKNHVKLITNINRYLLFLPKGDTISIVRKEITVTRTLYGVYLISPGSQQIIYKNQTLFAPHQELAGKPLIIGDVQLQINSNQQPDQEINLIDLELNWKNPKNLDPLRNVNLTSFVLPSMWTILLYLALFLVFGYTVIKYRRHVQKVNITN